MANRIIYPQAFREKCFNNLRYAMDIRLLMSAMDNGHDTIVRYYLEQMLDDPELYIDSEIVDDGERKIANAKLHAHAVRQELYSEFMELLITKTDQENVRENRRELLR